MSEIRATTISNAAGTGPITMTGQYAAKAWVNFDGTGAVAIRDSENVGSITDNGTGDYTVNLANVMNNANYLYVLTADYSQSTARNDNLGTDVSSVLAGSYRQHTYGLSNGNANDFAVVNSLIHGDLA